MHACMQLQDDCTVILQGLKLGRKGRDPAREIAEWNKLKGIAGKGCVYGIRTYMCPIDHC